ncbi:MAG: 50S ribosomal protein L17, partial [Acidobacteria bacterium]|nr:50S ribosomal protein L17 [Acidobacteriota bacterium]
MVACVTPSSISMSGSARWNFTTSSSNSRGISITGAERMMERRTSRKLAASSRSRRMVFSNLRNKEAVSSLFKDVAVKIADRKGGYTRIIKTGNRSGDAAEMALIELVDYNELYTSGKSSKTEKAKTTRRGRSKKSPAQAEIK